MEITIFPHPLHGVITPPPSKSQAHRLILAAALAQGESRIQNVDLSQDIRATLQGISALGVGYRWVNRTLSILGEGKKSLSARCLPDDAKRSLPQFDCKESGSTLRFLLPLSLVLCGGGHFTGHGRLLQRPLTPYSAIFTQQGISFAQNAQAVTVQGRLFPGEYRLPGHISSQFFTGLLFALPLLDGGSEIICTTPLQSRDYVEMTLAVLADCGISIEKTENSFRIPGNCTYRPIHTRIEADWSQAAFWYAAQLASPTVEVLGMNPDSVQGDKRILSFLADMRSEFPCTFDVSDCPDLALPLAAAAVLRPENTVTRLENTSRLRFKESDRITAIVRTLSAFGVHIQEEADALTILAPASLSGGCIDSQNDHRIAMMTAILASKAESPVMIREAECVAKSYPAFWQDYARAGGILQKK